MASHTTDAGDFRSPSVVNRFAFRLVKPGEPLYNGMTQQFDRSPRFDGAVWRVPQRAADAVRSGEDVTVYTDDTTSYLIAVDHRMAQAIVDDLEGGEPVIVEAEGWQIVGTMSVHQMPRKEQNR